MASSSTQSYVRPGVRGVTTKITHTCKIKHVADIVDTLNIVGGPDLVNRFRGGCFGRFLDWEHPGNLVGRLIFPFLARELVVPAPKTAMHFSVGGQTLRYGPPEHALVTGLSFGPAPVDVCANVDIRDSGFLNRVCGGMNCKADQLLGLFLSRSIGSEEDYLKAANIIMAWFVVLCYVGDRLLDPWIVILIDDPEAWDVFPWGAYSLKALMAYAGALPKTAAESGGTISIYGPWWSFLIWVLEAVPHIAGYCGKSGTQNLMPRFKKWRFKTPSNKLDFYALLDIQMPTHTSLDPTDAERHEAYWLTSIGDNHICISKRNIQQ